MCNLVYVTTLTYYYRTGLHSIFVRFLSSIMHMWVTISDYVTCMKARSLNTAQPHIPRTQRSTTHWAILLVNGHACIEHCSPSIWIRSLSLFWVRIHVRNSCNVRLPWDRVSNPKIESTSVIEFNLTQLNHESVPKVTSHCFYVIEFLARHVKQLV